jgi:hypothetical protein
MFFQSGEPQLAAARALDEVATRSPNSGAKTLAFPSSSCILYKEYIILYKEHCTNPYACQHQKDDNILIEDKRGTKNG